MALKVRKNGGIEEKPEAKRTALTRQSPQHESVPVPQFDLEALRALDNNTLLDYARNLARQKGYDSFVKFVSCEPKLSELLESRKLISRIYNTSLPPSDHTMDSEAPPSKRSVAPPPPVRSSLHPRPVADATINPPNGLAFDRTEASDRLIFHPKPIVEYMAMMNVSITDVNERITEATSFFNSETNRARAYFGNLTMAINSAKAKKEADEPLTHEEQYLIALSGFRKAILTLQSFKPDGVLAKTPSPTVETRIDTPVEQVEPEKKAQKEQVPKASFLSNPILYSASMFGVFSGVLHLTDSFTDIANHVPGDFSMAMKRGAAYATWYLCGAAVFAVTEVIRHRDVNKVAARLEVLESLGEEKKEDYNYVVTVLERRCSESRNSQDQAMKIQSDLFTDDKLKAAVDLFFSDSELWAGIVHDSSMHPDIERNFGQLIMNTDVKILYVHFHMIDKESTENERKMKFNNLYGREEKFKGSCDKLFARTRTGQYINPELRQALVITKLNNAGIELSKMIKDLQEHYDNMKGEEK